jgi:hypothetical protein
MALPGSAGRVSLPVSKSRLLPVHHGWRTPYSDVSISGACCNELRLVTSAFVVELASGPLATPILPHGLTNQIPVPFVGALLSLAVYIHRPGSTRVGPRSRTE